MHNSDNLKDKTRRKGILQAVKQDLNEITAKIEKTPKSNVLISSIITLLKNTRRRLNERYKLIKNSTYSIDDCRFEYSLINFPFYRRGSQNSIEKLKEKQLVIKLLREYLWSMDELINSMKNSPEDEISFDTKHYYFKGILKYTQNPNMYFYTITDKLYEKLQSISYGKEKNLYVSDFFIQLYLSIFLIDIPDENGDMRDTLHCKIFNDDVPGFVGYSDNLMHLNQALLNKPDFLGLYPIHISIKTNNKKMLNWLLSEGVNLHIKSIPFSKSPSQYAIKLGMWDLAKDLFREDLLRRQQRFGGDSFFSKLFFAMPDCKMAFYIKTSKMETTSNSYFNNWPYTHIEIEKLYNRLNVSLRGSNKKRVDRTKTGMMNSIILIIIDEGLGRGLLYMLKEVGDFKFRYIDGLQMDSRISKMIEDIQVGPKSTNIQKLLEVPKYDTSHAYAAQEVRKFFGGSSKCTIMGQKLTEMNLYRNKSDNEKVYSDPLYGIKSYVEYKHCLLSSKNSFFPISMYNKIPRLAAEKSQGILEEFMLSFSETTESKSISRFMTVSKSLNNYARPYKKSLKDIYSQNSQQKKAKVCTYSATKNCSLNPQIFKKILWLLVLFDLRNIELYDLFQKVLNHCDGKIPLRIKGSDPNRVNTKIKLYYYEELTREFHMNNFHHGGNENKYASNSCFSQSTSRQLDDSFHRIKSINPPIKILEVFENSSCDIDPEDANEKNEKNNSLFPQKQIDYIKKKSKLSINLSSKRGEKIYKTVSTDTKQSPIQDLQPLNKSNDIPLPENEPWI